MNSKLLQQLESLGLSDKESRVYLSGITLGSFTVSELADNADLKRPICYVIVDDFLNRGLFSLVPNTKKRTLQANGLHVLRAEYESKLSIIENIATPIEHLIGTKKAGAPLVNLFTGQRGVQQVGQMLLSSKEKKFYFIGSAESAVLAAGEVFARYYANTLRESDFVSYGIRIDRDFDYSQFDRPNNFAYYAPDGFKMKDNIIIFDDKVAIFADGETPYVVLFQSPSLVDSMISMFEGIRSISEEAPSRK